MKHWVRFGPLELHHPLLLCGMLYLLLYFDASGFLRLGLASALLHEAGHILVYWVFTGRCPVIQIGLMGLCMRHREAGLSPEKVFWLAAAGPGINLLLALGGYLRFVHRATVRGSAFLAANLLTGAFNLLPIPPLDGAQMLLSLWQVLKNRKEWRISPAQKAKRPQYFGGKTCNCNSPGNKVK